MGNPMNLNDVLGAIGRTIEMLHESLGTIPPIQFLVVQKKSGVPGVGISADVSDIPDFKGLSLRQKRLLVDQRHAAIYAFPRWNDVLLATGLEAPPPATEDEPLQRASSYGFGGPESAAHKALKELIAASPDLLGLRAKVLATSIEYPLPSGDSVDVLVEARDLWIAVEVKAGGAPEHEILRGLFQCVKYRALLRAVAGVRRLETEAESILALGGTLPAALLGVRNSLGIKVVEEVGGAEVELERLTPAQPDGTATRRRAVRPEALLPNS